MISLLKGECKHGNVSIRLSFSRLGDKVFTLVVAQ